MGDSTNTVITATMYKIEKNSIDCESVCLHTLCSDDNETILTTSTTSASSSVKCSPRWIVHHNSRSCCLRWRWEATTQQRCLDACIADKGCEAVEWYYDNKHCAVYRRWYQRIFPDVGFTVFQLNRRCDSTPGITNNNIANVNIYQ